MANYIVTGSSGFIGSALCRRLKQDGHKVIGVDSWATNGTDWSVWYTKFSDADFSYKLDLRSYDNIQRIFRELPTSINVGKIHAIFHCAAKPRVQFSVANPKESHESNVDTTLNLLEACREFGVKRFVYSASSSAYGNQDTLPLKESMKPNPLSPYALQKLVGEYYCRLYTDIYGIECIALRYFNVYGPNQNPTGGYPALIPKFATSMLNKEKPVIFGDGEQTRDFTFLDDVIDANIAAATTGNADCFGKTFNIGGGSGVSVNEIARIIMDFYSIDDHPDHGPAVVESKHTLADLNLSKDVLGWQPKTNLIKGLGITLNNIKDTFDDRCIEEKSNEKI